jgi:hypothetical protein
MLTPPSSNSLVMNSMSKPILPMSKFSAYCLDLDLEQRFVPAGHQRERVVGDGVGPDLCLRPAAQP